jgi:hypothetical protein
MNRDYYAGMTEGRIQEREAMSLDQKQMFEAGIRNERNRIITLLQDWADAEARVGNRELLVHMSDVLDVVQGEQ